MFSWLSKLLRGESVETNISAGPRSHAQAVNQSSVGGDVVGRDKIVYEGQQPNSDRELLVALTQIAQRYASFTEKVKYASGPEYDPLHEEYQELREQVTTACSSADRGDLAQIFVTDFAGGPSNAVVADGLSIAMGTPDWVWDAGRRSYSLADIINQLR
jgi:hypothetical protein